MTSSPLKLRKPLPLPAQIAALLCGILLLYFLLFRSWYGFASSIDHSVHMFGDFRNHFFPTAQYFLKTGEPEDGYFYSAFFALILRPLAPLSLDTAAIVWGLIQLLLTAALTLLPLRHALKVEKQELLAWFALSVISFPVLHNFKWGQVSVLLAVLTFVAFEASLRDRSIIAGLALAVAASIKYYTGFFLLYFLLRKDWKALGTFTTCGILFFGLLPLLFLGPDMWIQFHRMSFTGLAESGWIQADPNSQYYAHVLLRWWRNFDYISGETPLLLTLSGVALAAITLGPLLRLRSRNDSVGISYSLALLFVSLPFLVKTSWPHYFVYLPFCQMLTWSEIRSHFGSHRTRRRIALAFPVASILLSNIFVFLLFPLWISYQEKGCLFFANALLLPPLLWMAYSMPGSADSDENSREGLGRLSNEDQDGAVAVSS